MVVQAGNALAHMRMCKLGHESAGAMYYMYYI